MYVHPSVRPSVCPSVRRGFANICRRTHGGNGLKFCVLMYHVHLQNCLDYGHGLLVFLLLTPLWFNEMGQIWSFCAFPRERMIGMVWHFACWCILTTFRTDRLWSQCVDFSNFGVIWTYWNGSKRHISEALPRVLSSWMWSITLTIWKRLGLG